MSFRTEIALGVLILAALAVATFTGHPRRTDTRAVLEIPSTLRAQPTGSKGIYESFARLGVPVERRRTALFTLAADARRRRAPGLLVVVAPPIALLPAELDQVVSYVREGGTVFAAGRAGGITRCAGYDVTGTQDRLRADSVAVVAPAAGMRLPAVRRVLEPWTAQRLGADKRRKALEAQRRLETAEASACDTLLPLARDTLLRLGDGRPVILRLRYAGGGRVILVADADYLRNRAWRESDAPLLLVPLVDAERGQGAVTWDEYHQGYGRESSVTGALVGWLLRSPGGWALLQLTAVALVWLAVTAVRFGPALAVIERRRRSPLEHLEALAAGLESAAGSDTAFALTLAGLRRRLHRAGQGSGMNERAWLASLELSLPGPRGRAAVRRLQSLSIHRGGSERVLAAAQAVEDVWEELHPRTTRD